MCKSAPMSHGRQDGGMGANQRGKKSSSKTGGLSYEGGPTLPKKAKSDKVCVCVVVCARTKKKGGG